MTFFVNLDSALEEAFRRKAMEKFGYGRGAIKKALHQAIMSWIGEPQITKTRDPIKELRGLLKDVKIKQSSVELEDEAVELFG